MITAFLFYYVIKSTSERKVYIPKFVAQCLIDIKKEQDEVKEALGSEYTDYNLIKATTFEKAIQAFEFISHLFASIGE